MTLGWRGKIVMPAALALPAILWVQLTPGSPAGPIREAHRPPVTSPDYAGAVIPPNLAPLNRKVLEPGRQFHLRVSGATGSPVEVSARHGEIRIPLAAWRGLLAANRGAEIRTDIFVKDDAGWTHFDTLRNPVAAEGIDPYAVYRYIPPIYDKWDRISIRQRDLRSFDEQVLFDNQRDSDGKSVEGVCVNCHTFLNRRPDQMLLHIRPGRSSQVPAMILVRQGKAEKVDTRGGSNPPAAYSAWHPGGKLVAFSRNRILQMFHTAGDEVREVIDRDSDLSMYAVDTGQTFTVPQMSRPDRLETFPAWSPDGRYLYFTSAPLPWSRQGQPLEYDKVRYDLARIAYDPASGKWGEVEIVAAAAQLGKSISLPQISPDGRFVMFCGHDYGSFPIFQPGSDLYLLDLTRAGAAPRRIDEINSNRSDSYHSWSGNSRWILFSSKRDDGVFARLYLAYSLGDGRFAKPLVIPQEDPAFYERCLMTFNRPEFLEAPVTVEPSELTRAMGSRPALDAPRTPASADTPWQSLR